MISHRPLAFLLLSTVLVVTAVTAPAQNTQGMSREIQPLSEGVHFWQLHYYRDNYKQHILIFEIDGRIAGTTVRATLGDGLWNGAPIRRIQKRESALVAWEAVDQTPGGSLSWPGLTVVDGNLVAAPGQGPVFTETPDGFMELLDARPGPRGSAARLSTPDGLDLPVDAINRRTTTATLLMLTDPGVVRDSLLAGAAGMAQVALQFPPPAPAKFRPRQENAAPGPMLPWNAEAGDAFSWTSDPAGPPPASGVFLPQWVGLVGVGQGADVLKSTMNTAQSGTLRFTGSPPWSDYSTVVPLRSWLVRSGQIVVASSVAKGDPRGVRIARSALGISRGDNRLWLIAVLDGERDAEGMTEYELAQLCLALGVTDAAQGPQGNGVGLAAEGRQVLPVLRVPDRCRLALVVNVVNQQQEQEQTGKWVNLTRTAPAIVSGTRPLDWRNGPEKVLDGLQGPLPTLNQFWASNGGRNSPPSLTFDLRREHSIARIDVTHAEAVGFSPDLDVAAIRVQYRPKGESEWQDWKTVRNDPPRARQHIVLDPPIRAREVRLVFTRPSFLPENKTARIAEVVIWGKE